MSQGFFVNDIVTKKSGTDQRGGRDSLLERLLLENHLHLKRGSQHKNQNYVWHFFCVNLVTNIWLVCSKDAGSLQLALPKMPEAVLLCMQIISPLKIYLHFATFPIFRCTKMGIPAPESKNDILMSK